MKKNLLEKKSRTPSSTVETQNNSTPRPWRVEKFNTNKDDAAATWGVKEGETWIVIDLVRAEANRIANRYNQAVNAHQDLVEALKAVDNHYAASLDYQPGYVRLARKVLSELGEKEA